MSNSGEVSQSGQAVRDSSTAKKINNLLSSSKTRLEGLQLLSLFLPQCPDDDFITFCASWMQNCCKLDGLTNNRNSAARLLRDLFKISSNYPELKKSVSFFITTRYFDFFFKYFLNSDAGWTCTETCLLLYRGACGPFQEGLEKQLTEQVEREVQVSSTVARCFAFLPCVGGGGNDGVNYKKNWRSQFDKLLNVCHSLLNDLFADVEDIQENGTFARSHYSSNNNNNNAEERTVEHLTVQLHNYSSVLGSMLLSPFPAPKNIPSDLVFQLICRGLALNPKTSRKFAPSLKNALPDIHRSLLSLLKALIVTCKSQLLPYSRLIGKLIKQSLQWTNQLDVSHGNEKAFDRLRMTTYETLCDWLIVARNGSCVELIADVVVSNAVDDIRPKKGAVHLKEAKLQPKQATRKVDVTAGAKHCRAALKTLQFLLKFSGILLKPEVHKFLQETVVKLLVEVQKSPADVIAPFAEPACRSELYHLLLDLVHQPCPKWPPPTNFALRLFARGMNDVSPQVSSFCSTALNYATIIIHPQYDNRGFPLRDACDASTRADEPLETANEAVPLFPPMEVETVQIESTKGSKETLGETHETEAPDTKDLDEASEISSDEDSRNTITFSKESGESGKEPMEEDGKERESSPRVTEEEEPSAKRQKTEDVPREKTPSPTVESPSPPVLRETPESVKRKKSVERNSSGTDSTSPESTNEDSQPKGRYFLRSKTIGSSDEPEDTPKRTSSPESSRATPARSLAKSTPGGQKKRPRTRALSKAEGSVDGESKTEEKIIHDDEEDIRAAFDDSFLD